MLTFSPTSLVRILPSFLQLFSLKKALFNLLNYPFHVYGPSSELQDAYVVRFDAKHESSGQFISNASFAA